MQLGSTIDFINFCSSAQHCMSSMTFSCLACGRPGMSCRALQTDHQLCLPIRGTVPLQCCSRPILLRPPQHLHHWHHLPWWEAGFLTADREGAWGSAQLFEEWKCPAPLHCPCECGACPSLSPLKSLSEPPCEPPCKLTKT